MLNKGNLRDKLARQSGALPTRSAGGLGGSGRSGGSGGPADAARADAGLNKLIEAERAKRRDAASGEADAAKPEPKKKSVPSSKPGPASKGIGAARGSNKSTTQQGLR